MANRRALVEASLIEAGTLAGDPAPLVYARLFATNPTLEPLFIADRSGAVRGEMLARAFEIILDFAGDRQYGGHFVDSEIATHDAYGVPRHVFPTFFDTIAETISAIIGPAWTDQTAEAWAGLIADINASLPPEPS